MNPIAVQLTITRHTNGEPRVVVDSVTEQAGSGQAQPTANKAPEQTQGGTVNPAATVPPHTHACHGCEGVSYCTCSCGYELRGGLWEPPNVAPPPPPDTVLNDRRPRGERIERWALIDRRNLLIDICQTREDAERQAPRWADISTRIAHLCELRDGERIVDGQLHADAIEAAQKLHGEALWLIKRLVADPHAAATLRCEVDQILREADIDPSPSTTPPSVEGVELQSQQSQEPDCISRHDPQPISAGTAREPLGYRCAICRAKCDAKGAAL
jgi:hypothetical protein